MAETEWQRRRFIAGLGVASTAAVIAPHAFFRDAKAAEAAYKPRRIDVHHHVVPPPYEEFMASGKSTFRSPIDTSWWTLKGAIADMDRYGIATSIVSWPDLNGNLPGEFVSVVRACNEWCAQLARDYPGRFGNFATVALPNVDASLAEIAYALDTLKADGVRFQPSYNGKYLGHPDFAPVLAELDRRHAVAFVHPTQPQCCGQIIPNAPSATLEFPFDTTRTITDLLLSGSLARYPGIRWIFSHGGGTLPMLAGRISEGAKRNKKVASLLPDGPMAELKKLYVDTASAFFPSSWAGMMALSGPRKILFGTDDPYIKVAEVDEGIGALKLNAKLRAFVDRENALPLFPRLRKA